MRIGIEADHGRFELKVQLIVALKEAGYEAENFGVDEHVRTFLNAHFQEMKDSKDALPKWRLWKKK